MARLLDTLELVVSLGEGKGFLRRNRGRGEPWVLVQQWQMVSDEVDNYLCAS